MYPVENEDAPQLSTYLCYQCGFHPNTVLMGDAGLYSAYQAFYFRFKESLKPNITRTDTGLRITRRRYTTLMSHLKGEPNPVVVEDPQARFICVGVAHDDHELPGGVQQVLL